MPDLAWIRARTLVLNGEFDSVERREAGKRFAAAITGATRVELRDAGHLALLDQPAAYAQALAAFLPAAPA